MIPAEAVEAAARGLARHKWPTAIGVWESFGQGMQDDFRDQARAALEAAAPHMREDKRGDGDYRPGWDDRKTLSSLWQEHAPLPDEGLSERVYEALIEVAAWGYQQRKDEEL